MSPYAQDDFERFFYQAYAEHFATPQQAYHYFEQTQKKRIGGSNKNEISASAAGRYSQQQQLI